MLGNIRGRCECCVALRKESVDRNPDFRYFYRRRPVALRKESVDRNLWWGVRKAVGSLMVALRKESVDRNPLNDVTHWGPIVSLSARRAWIEIVNCQARQENF